MVKAEQWQGGG